jgi:hypothetical protein
MSKTTVHEPCPENRELTDELQDDELNAVFGGVFSTLNTVINSLGDALTTVARKA